MVWSSPLVKNTLRISSPPNSIPPSTKNLAVMELFDSCEKVGIDHKKTINGIASKHLNRFIFLSNLKLKVKHL
jgi:hypothetical protein